MASTRSRPAEQTSKGNLDAYHQKRTFTRTPEPAGGLGSETGQRGGWFVIQKHAARRLHYDLRLERDGAFSSWAVPKGPGLAPGEKRLAVRVEDHPLAYGEFEGVIPKGEYGGGTVMLWDRGRWEPVERKGKASEDRLDFVLEGQKLRGAWTLVRMARRSEREDNWLLIKRRDGSALLAEPSDLSVATGRTMEQIAADHDRAWTAAGEIGAPSEPVPDVASLPGARKGAMPASLAPQLATLAEAAPAGAGWLHEIKFDGYRIVARCSQHRVQLISRHGKDWTRRFPEIAALLANLKAQQALLDGEIVALDKGGTSSFRGLQEALSKGDTQRLVYQVFDVLYLDGYGLTGVGLEPRKQVLSALLAASGFTGNAKVRYTEHLLSEGPRFVEQACKLGLEGIVCKRRDAPYRSGRGKDWLKVKCTQHEEFLIGGFTRPSGTRVGFGALLLGAWQGDRLQYAGKVGTGFTTELLTALHQQLRKLEVKQSPFEKPPPERGAHWVRPRLVAEVEFSEWTRDGVLRHPRFRGLREDREPEEIRLGADRRRPPSAEPRPARAGSGRARGAEETEVAGVTLTHADRVLYPEQGITKLALAHYYQEVADWILPQLARRPLSLVRCPEGHAEGCFFQKHPRQTITKSIPRVRIAEKNGSAPYLYVRTLSDLVALVQLGVLELHVWGSRVQDVEHPDIMVFDLDPGPDVAWSEMMRVAGELRARLSGLGLEAFLRTTGGKGLHLVTPIVPERSWEEVKSFAHAVAQAHAGDDRSRVTANMAKTKRQGRIFIDYLRNGRGATAIASYSTRARAGAPVAVPVRWDELNAALRPDRYHVDNLRRRLSALRSDPWDGFEQARRPLRAGTSSAATS